MDVKYEYPVKPNEFNLTYEGISILEIVMFKSGYNDMTLNSDLFSSGIYYYRIKTGDNIRLRKMVLMK